MKLERCIPWLMSKHTWEDQQQEFKEEIKRIDTLRGEDFMATFPEVQSFI